MTMKALRYIFKYVEELVIILSNYSSLFSHHSPCSDEQQALSRSQQLYT
jgi:hypothetical protein